MPPFTKRLLFAALLPVVLIFIIPAIYYVTQVPDPKWDQILCSVAAWYTGPIAKGLFIISALLMAFYEVRLRRKDGLSWNTALKYGFLGTLFVLICLVIVGWVAADADCSKWWNTMN